MTENLSAEEVHRLLLLECGLLCRRLLAGLLRDEIQDNIYGGNLNGTSYRSKDRLSL